MKGLASSDDETAKASMSKADKFIGNQNIKYDKTSINKSHSSIQSVCTYWIISYLLLWPYLVIYNLSDLF